MIKIDESKIRNSMITHGFLCPPDTFKYDEWVKFPYDDSSSKDSCSYKIFSNSGICQYQQMPNGVLFSVFPPSDNDDKDFTNSQLSEKEDFSNINAESKKISSALFNRTTKRTRPLATASFTIYNEIDYNQEVLSSSLEEFQDSKVFLEGECISGQESLLEDVNTVLSAFNRENGLSVERKGGIRYSNENNKTLLDYDENEREIFIKKYSNLSLYDKDIENSNVYVFKTRYNKDKKNKEKELKSARRLASFGYVIYMLPQDIEGIDGLVVKSSKPDAIVNSYFLVFKNIEGYKEGRIQNNFRKGAKQADVIYIETNSNIGVEEAKREINRQINSSSNKDKYEGKQVLVATNNDIYYFEIKAREATKGLPLGSPNIGLKSYARSKSKISFDNSSVNKNIENATKTVIDSLKSKYSGTIKESSNKQKATKAEEEIIKNIIFDYPKHYVGDGVYMMTGMNNNAHDMPFHKEYVTAKITKVMALSLILWD